MGLAHATGAELDEDSDNGGRTPSTTLADVSPAAQAKRLAYLDGVLKNLDGIDAGKLSAANQVNFAVYRPQIEHLAAELRSRDYEMPFNADSSFWSDLGFMARADLRDAAAYRAYAARLRDVPRYFDQQVANMRAGLSAWFLGAARGTGWARWLDRDGGGAEGH